MMRYRLIPILLILSFSIPVAAEPKADDPPSRKPSPEIDAEMREVLEQINAAGAYGVPRLRLKKDANYANTAGDVKPFRHVEPFKQHFLKQLEYTGPGRAIPEPTDVKTVKLGFIGPIMSTVSVATGGKSHAEALGIKMLQGARLAIEQANAAGGYLKRSIPFELVVSNDNGLWGASGNEIIKMAYTDKVWAILGTIDGANSHIAIRVALKAEILMMNSGDTDPTFVETNIPWVARCIGDDRQQGYLLMDYMYRKLGFERVGIIRASNRYGRFGVREIRDGSRRRGRPIPVEMAYKLGTDDFSLQLDRLEQANVEAIVHWGDDDDGARILNQMRDRGMKHPYFACDRCLSDKFVRIAGKNVEGVVCTSSWDPTRKNPAYLAFRKAFRKRFGEKPETFAAHAYDGMNMLVWAVQVAGLNRAKIRDVICYRTKPWKGVTGDIPLSAVLDDVGKVFLVTREGGTWKYHSREDLELPRAAETPTPQSEIRNPKSAIRNPQSVDAVLIGYFGPSDPAHPEGGDMWRAAGLAVEEANAQGGYRGKPFRLVAGWSKDPWGTGVAQVTRMAYVEKVWAIVGGIDGASTHLAEQVVAKARLTLVNPASTDKTVNLANVPWMFSCVPGDHMLAGALAAEIAARVGKNPFVLVSSTDHDSRLLTVELNKHLAGQRLVPRFHFQFKAEGQRGRGAEAQRHKGTEGQRGRGAEAQRHKGTEGRKDRGAEGQRDGVCYALAMEIVKAEPAAVVVMAGVCDSARLVRSLRDHGFTGLVFGGPSMGRRQFLERAGDAAEGVVFPLLDKPAGPPMSRGFKKIFERRFEVSPDYAAARTYDAVRLLVAAIRKAGLNRARIRDAVKQLAPWEGVAGTIDWDKLGGNPQTVPLGTILNGRVAPLAAGRREGE